MYMEMAPESGQKLMTYDHAFPKDGRKDLKKEASEAFKICNVCVKSREDKVDERRANSIILCAEVRGDSKCQRVGEDTRAGGLSRRNLRG